MYLPYCPFIVRPASTRDTPHIDKSSIGNRCYSVIRKVSEKKKIKIVILSRPSKNLQQDINRMLMFFLSKEILAEVARLQV